MGYRSGVALEDIPTNCFAFVLQNTCASLIVPQSSKLCKSAELKTLELHTLEAHLCILPIPE